MPKIDKTSIKKYRNHPTLTIFKYENLNKYQCVFYVGQRFTKNGSIQKSLKTSNLRDAEQLAKKLYVDWKKEYEGKDTSKIIKDLTRDIANAYFASKIKQYKIREDKNVEYAKKEKRRYDNYIAPFFLNIDYTNDLTMENVIWDLVDELKTRKIKDTTISKYMNTISQVFKYGQKKGLMKSIPDIPVFSRINEERLPYFPREQKMIREETFKRFKETENKFYLYLWEYLNLLQSFTYVRPGLEPLRIKYPHTKLIDDPDNLNQPVLQITLFNTKNKPKISGTTSPYFNSIYFDILHREQPTIEDYLLFPREKNREKIYDKIRRTFKDITSDLGLYVVNGKTRSLYSYRHSNAVKRYKETGNLQIVSDGINTSAPVLKSNYLHTSDENTLKRHKELYPELYLIKSSMKSKDKK